MLHWAWVGLKTSGKRLQGEMGASVAFQVLTVILKTKEVLSGVESHSQSPHAQSQRSKGGQACQLKAALGSSRCWHALEPTEGAVPGLSGRHRVTGGAADRESWWLQAGAASLLPGVLQPVRLQPVLQTMPSVPAEDHLHCDFTAGAHPDRAGRGRGALPRREWSPAGVGAGWMGNVCLRQEGMCWAECHAFIPTPHLQVTKQLQESWLDVPPTNGLQELRPHENGSQIQTPVQ